jgi:hypothetical protein
MLSIIPRPGLRLAVLTPDGGQQIRIIRVARPLLILPGKQ